MKKIIIISLVVGALIALYFWNKKRVAKKELFNSTELANSFDPENISFTNIDSKISELKTIIEEKSKTTKTEAEIKEIFSLKRSLELLKIKQILGVEFSDELRLYLDGLAIEELQEMSVKNRIELTELFEKYQ